MNNSMKKIDNIIIAEILFAKVVNHSQRISMWIQNNNFLVFLTFITLNFEKLLF